MERQTVVGTPPFSLWVVSEPRISCSQVQRRSLLTDQISESVPGRKRHGESIVPPEPRVLPRGVERVEQPIEELRRILSSGASLGAPQRSYFGVSPPARCNDGLVHDAMWQRDYHNSSRSNLQALRELDQTGGIPFLRGDDACGDTRLILGSPDFSFLASYGANHSRSGSLTCSAAAGRSPSTCINKVMGY